VTLRDALTTELADAIRRRDRPVVAGLRTALAALANAEALPAAEPGGTLSTTIHVAGATAGLGATEARRRYLSDEHERALVAHERAELMSHADRLTRLCRHDEADGARRAAAALAAALDGAR
jgi:hypothetical protein